MQNPASLVSDGFSALRLVLRSLRHSELVSPRLRQSFGQPRPRSSSMSVADLSDAELAYMKDDLENRLARFQRAFYEE